MIRTLMVMVFLPLLLISFATARPAKKEAAHADYAIQIDDRADGLSRDGILFSAMQADTYWLASYTFDSCGTCAPQGWHSVDWTNELSRSMFHVDDFRVISGAKSIWCGARPDTNEQWCYYAKLPGYGNYWEQWLSSRTFAVAGNVTISYTIRIYSEPNYDYTFFEYFDGVDWQVLETYDGIYDSVVTDLPVPKASPTTVQVRFRFSSDGAWSDEDGLWDSEGACIVDDISIHDDSLGLIDSEDWEDESEGTCESLDGDWTADYLPGYGDYAGLYPGLGVLQEDECTRSNTCLWGFFNGSTDVYDCVSPPHPEQKAIPYENERGQFIDNMILSPWIDLTAGGTVPATALRAVLEYDEYRDQPLDNLVSSFWAVRTRSGETGCPRGWMDRDSGVRYGSPYWIRIKNHVGDLIENSGGDYVQIALGVWDMCPWFCGHYGTGDCHGHSPLFDDVKFYRINTTGPVFYTVRDIDLFQDNFPEDGTLTGTVRIDASIDRMPRTSPNIYPGDSLVFNCYEPTYGLGTAGDGRAAVYCYVRSTSGGSPADWEAQEAGVWTAKRYPYVGAGPTAGSFYQFQCDTSYQDVGMTNPTPDKFAFDLNDDYFTPPARIDFYFSAVDGAANTVYWTQAGHTLSQTEAEESAMEMQCLPTGNSDILYVDNFSGRGAQPYFDSAFELMGITPDRYDKRGPSSLVANGLGSRAAVAQVVNVYQKILYNCGDLPNGTIGDGTGDPEKSPDAPLLYAFLDQTSDWDPGLYISGDDVAEEMKDLNTAPFLDLFSFINYNLIDGNHVAAGYTMAPSVIGGLTGGVTAGYIFQHAGPPVVADTIVAYGGCPLINDFDVLEPTGAAVQTMYYSGGSINAAVVAQTTTNAKGMDARVVLAGFSYHYICDDNPGFPFDRLDHLIHIIRWFENVVDDPVGAGDAPLVTSLAQNYPNPFNPVTTIEFSLAAREHVSLKVYNVAGQLVRTIVDENRRSDIYKEIWDGLDNAEQPVASGVYFYRLVAGEYVKTRKMVLLK